MTAADRPSVTDNARAEAWDECARATAHAAEYLGTYPPNPYRAAGRAEATTGWGGYRIKWDAETTTATDEDAAGYAEDDAAHVRFEAEQVIRAASYGDDVPEDINAASAAEEFIERVVSDLADAGLLATARTRPTEPPEWRIEGTWLVEVVGDCTCGVGGPHGHERGCGLEPVVNLATLPGWPADPPAVIH